MENESKSNVEEREQQTAQSVETVETPDTPAGGDVEGPRDGEGCESVTVIIVGSTEKICELVARSVKKNLRGVDADIHVVYLGEHGNTLAEVLQGHLPHIHTERILVMVESMFILQPVTLYEIGCLKARRIGKAVTFDTQMPVMMRKSVLQELLPEVIQERPHASVVEEYFRTAYPDVKPIVKDDWTKTDWLLTLVSENPNIGRVRKWTETQRFMHVGDRSWTQEVWELLKELFGEETD